MNCSFVVLLKHSIKGVNRLFLYQCNLTFEFMFRKTIAVLLMLSIVLSSCGKKDKDKSNDFLRVTPPPPTTNSQLSKPNKTGVLKPYLEALNDCINIHMSCPVHSEACRKAQDNDRNRIYSVYWQACLDSEICPEFKEDFHKAQLDCFASEVDYLVAEQACYEARLACPNPNLNFNDCPGSELVCGKYDSLKPKISSSDCPKYVPELSNPKYAEYSEVKKKYKDANDKVWEVCHEEGADKDPNFPMNCWKARVEKVALNIPYTKAQKSCLESEFNGTTHS
jgi:hypothetical protein